MHEKSGIWVNSRIQKYQEYIPLLKAGMGKKSQTRYAQTVSFFHTTQRFILRYFYKFSQATQTRYSQPHLHSTTFTVKKLPCTKGFILLILINHSAGREGFELFTCSRTPRGPAVADHEENDGDLSIEKSY